jgi:serine/threonine protein kinase
VGRNDEDGFFYYTMELADDRDRGQQIDPEKYRAKTLLSELRARGSFLIQDCLTLGLSMVRAVDCMHQAGLVHRDIKPANIVYLHDTPRLADIGSVKLLDDSISIAGTPGYMPLEGPGRPAGDIFSLGRVFYEMVTGKDCAQYPELLDSLEESIHPELRGLRKIILNCCEQMPEDRYPDAGALARALDDLANPKPVKATPAVTIGGLVVLGILVYALYALLN